MDKQMKDQMEKEKQEIKEFQRRTEAKRKKIEQEREK